MSDEKNRPEEGQIEGKNALLEALKAGRSIDKVYIAKGEAGKNLKYIASKARAAGAVISEVDRRKLDYMSKTKAHQGVIALVAVHEYSSVDDIIKAAEAKKEKPLVIICDEISIPITWER